MPSPDLREQLELIRAIQPAVHAPQNWNYENTGPMYKAYMHPPHDVGGQFDVPIYYEEKEEEQWELNTYVTCEVLAGEVSGPPRREGAGRITIWVIRSTLACPITHVGFGRQLRCLSIKSTFR